MRWGSAMDDTTYDMDTRVADLALIAMAIEAPTSDYRARAWRLTDTDWRVALYCLDDDVDGAARHSAIRVMLRTPDLPSMRRVPVTRCADCGCAIGTGARWAASHMAADARGHVTLGAWEGCGACIDWRESEAPS